MLVATLFTPHPPIALPEIGDHTSKTLTKSFERLAETASRLKPDIVVAISPHGQYSPGRITLHTAGTWSYSFAPFGASLELRLPVDGAFTFELAARLAENGCPTALRPGNKSADKSDHGAAVPLYFISKAISAKYVFLTPGGHGKEELEALGRTVKMVCGHMDARVILIASGDQSHYLAESGPYGYSRAGEEYDATVREIFTRDPFQYLELDRSTVDIAGQCAFEPWSIALCAMKGLNPRFELIGYEAPYGVGYLTASAETDARVPPEPRPGPYCALARIAIYHSVCRGGQPEYSELAAILDEGSRRELESTRAGAFVSIHSKGNLRGCIGMIEPAHDHVGAEICYCAHQASMKDPRFPPIRPEELSGLDIKVDVLSAPEPISGLHELDVKRYGVIVSKGIRRGLLLPDLEGVDTPEEQIAIALSKAGLTGSDYSLERFEVMRHTL